VGIKSAKAVVQAIEVHLERVVDFIRSECKESIRASDNQLASELLNILEAQLGAAEDAKVRFVVLSQLSLISYPLPFSPFFPFSPSFSLLFLYPHFPLTSSLSLTLTLRPWHRI
jgi:hypothetical protein